MRSRSYRSNVPARALAFTALSLCSGVVALAQGPVELLMHQTGAAPLAWIEVFDWRAAQQEWASSSLARTLDRLSVAVDLDALEELAAHAHAETGEALLEAGRQLLQGGFENALESTLRRAGCDAELAARAARSLEGSVVCANVRGRGLMGAVGLAPGASTLWVDRVLPALENGPDPLVQGVLTAIGRSGEECSAVWTLGQPDRERAAHVVIRPGALIFVASAGREGAWAMSTAQLPNSLEATFSDGDPRFLAARARARARHERGWAFAALADLPIAGDWGGVRPWIERACGRRLLDAELGLGVRDGQVESRLRLGFEARAEADADAPSLATGPSWSTLAAVPADAIWMCGVAQGPLEILQRAQESSLLPPLLSQLAGAASLSSLPFFAALSAPGGMSNESLFFVRPAGPGVPQLYLAVPPSRSLSEALDGIESESIRDLPLGRGLSLSSKPIAEGRAWLLVREHDGERRSLVAWTRVDDSWVLSNVSAQLSSLQRQRARERIDARRAALEPMRRRMSELLAGNAEPRARLVAFTHLRAKSTCETYWPTVHAALSLLGVLEDQDAEEMPDAAELSEWIGDTTGVLLALPDAWEYRARGLLGGLAVLF